MTLTATGSDSERTYRRAYVGLWIGSGLFLAAALAAGYPVVGAVGFWAIAVGTIAVYRSYEGPLFDERDRNEYQAAAGVTLALFGWAAAVVFPTMTILSGLGVAEWPPWLAGVSWFVPLLYGTLGITWAVESYR